MSNQPLKIAYRPISDLIPYARNSRTHNDAQVAQIAASMEGHDWRFCVENDCYVATSTGLIYRVCRRQRSRAGRLIEKYETILMRGSSDKDGYMIYKIPLNGERKKLKGHRLVLSAFKGSSKLECNHKDGNKKNNSIGNLEWVTSAANQAHAIATGLKNPYKPNTKVAKIMRSDYVAIYILHKHFGIKRAALAQANRVSRQTIDNVINKVEVACHV